MYLREKVKTLRRLEECPITQPHGQHGVEKRRKVSDRTQTKRGLDKKHKKVIAWVQEQDFLLFQKIKRTASKYLSAAVVFVF